MARGHDLFVVVKAMLQDIVDTARFLPVNIQRGFQPVNAGNFISITQLNPFRTSMRGYNTYDPDNDLKINHILFNNPIQVDFFTDLEFAANDGAKALHQYLAEWGDEFLTENYPGTSIGEIDEIVNNSDVGDKGKYIYRYTIRFEIFTHEELARPQLFADEIIPIPVFIE